MEGRKANEDERIKAEGEVQALLARRDFLVGDVDSLEQHIITQRERLRDTATAIHEMVERVPGRPRRRPPPAPVGQRHPGKGHARAGGLAGSFDGRCLSSDTPTSNRSPRSPRWRRAIIGFWDADHTFQASIDQPRRGADEYVFYDGPPFANGLPHYGHLLTGFVKDAVPRYQTMRGQRVERRFGWDCHGLPAEVETEKELGIAGHPAITAFGIGKFNDACRTSVLRYTDEWERYVTRQARWVDFENDYKTLDLSYMESVMWAFKTLWDKGLVYEGFRVLAVLLALRDAAVATPRRAWTTSTATARTRRSPSAFELGRPASAHPGLDDDAVDAAVATSRSRSGRTSTTPWSRRTGTRYVLAEARLAAYERELAGATQVGHAARAATWSAARTRRCSRSSPTQPNAFQVLAGDFVDHRGRHRRRAHGARLRRGRPERCATRTASRRSARWTSTAATPPRSPRGPACTSSTPTRWSSGTSRTPASSSATTATTTPTRTAGAAREPLVYRAISSWFVEVTKFRDRMVELNQQITLGARAHQGRQLRQVAGQRPRLVDQPQPLLGLADPGVEERRPALPAHRRLRLASTTSSATSA